MNTYISTLHTRRPSRVALNANLNSRVATRRGLGPIANSLFMGVILTIMGIMYLSQVTKANDYSFVISSLEEQKTELLEKHQVLTIEAARLARIENVKKSEVAKNLTRPSSVEYVR